MMSMAVSARLSPLLPCAMYIAPTLLKGGIGALEALFDAENDPHINPLGVKGLGEIAYVGMAPALANAVFHATGCRLRDLPISIESLMSG